MENCGGGKPPALHVLLYICVIFRDDEGIVPYKPPHYLSPLKGEMARSDRGVILRATSKSQLLSHSLFHFTLDIAVGFLFGGDIAFIVKFFTFTKPHLHLCPSFFEIDG